MRFFRSQAFSAANGLSFAMFFSAFGAIFLMSQYFQTAQGFGRSRPAPGRCRGPRCR
jgi:hypothetical protein